MNQAVTSTNVVLNMAISPTLWLISSNLIILEKPLVGYNNKLKVSDESMKFGLNKNVNYYGVPHSQLKKVHQEQSPKHHLDTLDKKPDTTETTNKSKQEKKPISVSKNDDHNIELISIMAIS